MTLQVTFGISFLVVVVFLQNCSAIAAPRSDLEYRRSSLQTTLDHLTQYCPFHRRDISCRKSIPRLTAELRQIDDLIENYQNDDDFQRGSYQVIGAAQQTPADLIRRRKFSHAEQDLLGHVSDVQSVVREVYDKQTENFDLLADFATAVRDGELKFLIYKHLIEETVRGGHDGPIKIIRVIRGVRDEVLQGHLVSDETHILATNMVDNLKVLFETGVAKLWIDGIISNSFEQDTSIQKLADEISSLDPDLFSRIIYKVVVAVYPLTDKHQLMRNVEQFHLVPQLIDSFNVIYNEMAKANDINGKPYILKLTYYCRELLVRSNLTALSPEKKLQLLTLEQRLPASVRSLVFNDRVCLKNKYVHDYLHIAHGHPRLRRYAIMAPGTQLRWIPKPMNYTTCFEFPYGGYLFADNVNPDGRSRLVAASKDSDEIVLGSEWIIEPVGDDCLIRNSAYNELLYVGDEFDQDHLSNRVFTIQQNAVPLMPGSDDRFKWTIEGC